MYAILRGTNGRTMPAWIAQGWLGWIISAPPSGAEEKGSGFQAAGSDCRYSLTGVFGQEVGRLVVVMTTRSACFR